MRKKSDVDNCVRKRRGWKTKRQRRMNCEYQNVVGKEAKVARFLYAEILRVDREFEDCEEEVLDDF